VIHSVQSSPHEVGKRREKRFFSCNSSEGPIQAFKSYLELLSTGGVFTREGSLALNRLKEKKVGYSKV
jgi:hypothetical protein